MLCYMVQSLPCASFGYLIGWLPNAPASYKVKAVSGTEKPHEQHQLKIRSVVLLDYSILTPGHPVPELNSWHWV